jgi:hypothetical protein
MNRWLRVERRFEWTAPGFRILLQRIRAAHPDKLLLQNRGAFFFDNRLPHYGECSKGRQLDVRFAI